MRPTTSVVALLILAGSLTGCGGDDGPASPAATEREFCDTYSALFAKLAEAKPEDTGAGIRAMKDWVGDVREVGTPQDMPEDARVGFENMLETLDRVDEDASRKELEGLAQELTRGDQESAQAFASYTMKTCADAMDDVLQDLEE